MRMYNHIIIPTVSGTVFAVMNHVYLCTTQDLDHALQPEPTEALKQVRNGMLEQTATIVVCLCVADEDRAAGVIKSKRNYSVQACKSER